MASRKRSASPGTILPQATIIRDRPSPTTEKCSGGLEASALDFSSGTNRGTCSGSPFLGPSSLRKLAAGAGRVAPRGAARGQPPPPPPPPPPGRGRHLGSL